MRIVRPRLSPLGLVLAAAHILPAQPPSGYQPAWNDEFVSPRLDAAKWESLSGVRRDGIMDPADAYTEGGELVLRTRKVGEAFHHGFIRTRGRYEPTYGYFEARVKLPRQVGHWAAFWLHGRQVCAGCPGVEVDIMEYPYRGNTVVHNLHWNGYGSEHKSVGSGNKPFTGSPQDWHVFAVEWTPQVYVFFIDGKETWRSSAKVSQVPGYIKLTDEVGDWAGDIRQATLPDEFRVDYIRVYQKPGITLARLGQGRRRTAGTLQLAGNRLVFRDGPTPFALDGRVYGLRIP